MLATYQWYIIGAIALVVLLIIIALFNGIINAENRAKRGWADVIAYERNKLKLMPELERLCKGYTSFEGQTQMQITQLRQAIASLDQFDIEPDKLKTVQNLASELNKGLQLQVENYPDLKASNVFQQLMTDWRETQENVTAAISVYNHTVALFNDKIQMFPSNAVNGALLKRKVLKPFHDAEAQMSFEYQPNF
ncbi:LemA family protein [Cysteiniphilum sp. QT6929]|uniref:LemA family protein n=1 Tax=Cysteiniphilum sp. QT6929 TaxID=2975055 RepID=UPI0024B37ECC|nr:LemA family protein [Cysteiniphilum sp. QT6929]WHN64963.1 LemA family protein [Cysteiniphilum sp. QT6929]